MPYKIPVLGRFVGLIVLCLVAVSTVAILGAWMVIAPIGDGLMSDRGTAIAAPQNEITGD